MRDRRALAFFFVSGFAALVYETVWTRKLVLVFGATLTSASAVLAGFMAGMAAGALLGAKLARGTRDPLRLYGALELGIAACAAVFPLAVRAILSIMETTTLPVGPLRLALIFAALLPATTLMGMTFPLLCSAGEGEDAGRDVGHIYAANLIGSCLGALAGAYLLLPLIGLSGSHWLAVALNAGVGLAALSLPERARKPAAPAVRLSDGERSAFACLFISGLCGMAFEVVWLRILMPSFNNSAYGFASVIFVFLLGLGGGSFLAARSPVAGAAALGGLQMLAGIYAYVGYRLYELGELVQIRFGAMDASTISPVVFAPLAETVAILLPLAVLQGMLLPVAARMGGKPGPLYFWNTVGGICGALLAGFWWVPAVNVQNALFITIALCALSGAAVLALASPAPRTRWAAAACAALPLFLWTSRAERLPKKVLLDWLNRHGAEAEFLFYADDPEASVAVPDQNRRLIINGVGVTGYTNATKMMAHIPLLLHPAPKRVLIICFGMGTTFRSALRHGVDVEVVDIVPSVFETFKLFYADAAQMLGDPRAAHFVNDGRNHLLGSRGGYDVIIVDPSPPLYAAGTVNLYSRDFYELARKRLRPGGILTVWLPEYPEPDFKMVMKSFAQAMPRTEMWLGTRRKGGLVMLGSEAPIAADRALVRRRLAQPALKTDLSELDDEFKTEDGFWSLRLGTGESYASYLAGSPEITDDFPRLEYPYFRSKTRAYQAHPSVLGR
jgi:spermidine synthase